MSSCMPLDLTLMPKISETTLQIGKSKSNHYFKIRAQNKIQAFVGGANPSCSRSSLFSFFESFSCLIMPCLKMLR